MAEEGHPNLAKEVERPDEHKSGTTQQGTIEGERPDDAPTTLASLLGTIEPARKLIVMYLGEGKSLISLVSTSRETLAATSAYFRATDAARVALRVLKSRAQAQQHMWWSSPVFRIKQLSKPSSASPVIRIVSTASTIASLQLHGTLSIRRMRGTDTIAADVNVPFGADFNARTALLLCDDARILLFLGDRQRSRIFLLRLGLLFNDIHANARVSAITTMFDARGLDGIPVSMSISDPHIAVVFSDGAVRIFDSFTGDPLATLQCYAPIADGDALVQGGIDHCGRILLMFSRGGLWLFDPATVRYGSVLFGSCILSPEQARTQPREIVHEANFPFWINSGVGTAFQSFSIPLLACGPAQAWFESGLSILPATVIRQVMSVKVLSEYGVSDVPLPDVMPQSDAAASTFSSETEAFSLLERFRRVCCGTTDFSPQSKCLIASGHLLFLVYQVVSPTFGYSAVCNAFCLVQETQNVPILQPIAAAAAAAAGVGAAAAPAHVQRADDAFAEYLAAVNAARAARDPAAAVFLAAAAEHRLDDEAVVDAYQRRLEAVLAAAARGPHNEVNPPKMYQQRHRYRVAYDVIKEFSGPVCSLDFEPLAASNSLLVGFPDGKVARAYVVT